MEKRRYPQRFCFFSILAILATGVAHAAVGIVLEQPIGQTGRLTGAGHVAVYLSRVCAASPNRLRRCRPGEYGVVIARYHHADRDDWTAIPLVPYLYAVDRPQEIPAFVDAAIVTQLRNRYRENHLQAFLSADPHKRTHRIWTQLVGSAYSRRIYVYEVKTTSAQDDALIRKLNSEPNISHFNFFFNNCANFAKSILNFYYPHSVHRSFTADLGLMTPKQTAKSLVSYSKHHPDVKVSVFVIPQVPGNIPRSGAAYGVIEALLKKKQYVIPLIPLTIWEPYVTAALVGTYLTRGRFNPEKNSIVLNRNDDLAALSRDVNPRQNQNVKPGQLPSLSLRELSRGNAPQMSPITDVSTSTMD